MTNYRSKVPDISYLLEEQRVRTAKKELARLDPNRPRSEEELRYARLFDVRYWTGHNGDGS